MESIILKNRIYLEKGILYSDYILAREEDINILNRERKIPIEGRSFRAEVVEVNREHRAKVRFLDLEDDFEEGKARYFPIDRYYRESYFAPEKGDIVDIYFKSKNERHAAVKGSSTEGRDDIKNPPEEKVLARTPGGYTIVMSNDSIEVRGRDGKNVARVKGDRITYRLKKDGADSEITIDSKMIRLRNKNSEMVIDDTKTELNSNGTKVRLSDKGIEFM
ncbi:MAG: hypothetical protein GX175_02315, partial [Halanaerobiaceae bacterium]|nr:hypothetical protein [Halanaerobiaceae bacterium]